MGLHQPLQRIGCKETLLNQYLLAVLVYAAAAANANANAAAAAGLVS